MTVLNLDTSFYSNQQAVDNQQNKEIMKFKKYNISKS